MRITENKIADLIADLNRLEAKIHPIDSARYRNGALWSYDYYALYGVYIRRGNMNPLYDLTPARVEPKIAYMYLLGVKKTLEYNLAYGIEHS